MNPGPQTFLSLIVSLNVSGVGSKNAASYARYLGYTSVLEPSF